MSTFPKLLFTPNSSSCSSSSPHISSRLSRLILQSPTTKIIDVNNNNVAENHFDSSCIFDTSNNNIRQIEALMDRDMDQIYSRHLCTKLERHFDEPPNDPPFDIEPDKSLANSPVACFSSPRFKPSLSSPLPLLVAAQSDSSSTRNCSRFRSYASQRRLRKMTNATTSRRFLHVYNRKYVANARVSCSTGSSRRYLMARCRRAQSIRIASLLNERIIEILNRNVLILFLFYFVHHFNDTNFKIISKFRII